MNNEKRIIWLVGNGYNMQFAPYNIKNWWSDFALMLPLDQQHSDEGYSWADIVNPYYGQELYKLFDDKNKFLTSPFLYLIAAIIKQVFIKIDFNCKEKNQYYESVMKNTLNNDFAVNFTNVFDKSLLNFDQNYYGPFSSNKIINYEMWKKYWWSHEMRHFPFFKIIDNNLLIKCNFFNVANYLNFKKSIDLESINPTPKYNDKKCEIEFIFYNANYIYSMIYLKIIELWIEKIRSKIKFDEYDSHHENIYSENSFNYIYSYKSNYVNYDRFYTTNYFNVHILPWLTELKVYNDTINKQNHAVFLKDKLLLMKKNLEIIKKNNPNEENHLFNIRELNIFGLNPAMDTDLIKELINIFDITDVLYWYHTEFSNSKLDEINKTKQDVKQIFKAANIRTDNLKFDDANKIWNYKKNK